MISQIPNENRVFGLDLMRAAAILMVVIGHGLWVIEKPHPLLAQLLPVMSFLGVEVFFVLSGFLIGRILLKEFKEEVFDSSKVRHFLKRRWYRTLPNYFLILIINFLLAIYFGYQVDDPWKYFLFLQNFAHPMLLFFPESWSLAVEEFTYILLPILLLLMLKIRTNATRHSTFIASVIILTMLAVIAKIAYHISHGVTTLEYWNLALKAVVIFRVDSILIGVVAAVVADVFPRIWLKYKAIAVLIGCIGMMFFTFGVGFLQLTLERFPAFWNVIYLPLVSIVVAFFLPFLSTLGANRNAFTKSVTYISVISYSVYLLHYSIVLQSLKHLQENLGIKEIPILALYIFLTLVLSTILYFCYEKPLTMLRDRKPR